MRVFGSGALPTFSPPATGDYEPICLTSYRIGFGMYDQYGSTGRGGRAAKRLDTLLQQPNSRGPDHSRKATDAINV